MRAGCKVASVKGLEGDELEKGTKRIDEIVSGEKSQNLTHPSLTNRASYQGRVLISPVTNTSVLPPHIYSVIE